MSNIAGDTTFKITNTKLYVAIVTLPTEDHVKLTKQLNEGFKRPVYWNEYKTKIESKNLDDNNLLLFNELQDCLFLLLITLLLMLLIIQLTTLIIEF